jgi:hypothetical protein
MLSGHRRNAERFSLAYFLIYNGMPPEMAGILAISYDMRPGKDPSTLGWISTQGYDKQARKQCLTQIPRQARDGSLYLRKDGTRKKIMDMNKGYVA